jgi:hypothetical protein
VVVGLMVVTVAFLGGAVTERTMRASSTESGTPQPSAARPRVVVYGDSLVVQSEPYLAAVGRSLGVKVTPRAVGGIAPCDALDWLAEDLERAVPDIVVLSF